VRITDESVGHTESAVAATNNDISVTATETLTIVASGFGPDAKITPKETISR